MGSRALRFVDGALPVAAAWAVYRAPARLHTALVTEDGPLEWLQVGALAVACVALAVRGVRARSLPLVAGAAVAGFVAGEEMAWGTRLLHVSARGIAMANRQGDVTLHNLHGGLTASFLVIAVAGLAGAMWVAGRRHPVVVWFAAPAVYAAGRLLYTGAISPRAAKVSEVLELALYVAVARVAVRPPAPAPAAAPAVTPDRRAPAIP